MKTSLFITVLAAAALTQATSAKAQFYKPRGEDGIAASPRARATLDERAAMARAASLQVQVVDVSTVHSSKDYIAASPKVRAQMAERGASAAGTMSTDPNLAKAPQDGIAASPKVRQQMRTTTAQPAPVEVAPISK